MRKMMRRDREITDKAECYSILHRADTGYLGTADGSGRPLVTPVNHVVVDNTVYFHCAMEGHKIENLTLNPQVCLTAVLWSEIDKVEMTTYYECAMAFGRARVVHDHAERSLAIKAIIDRFCDGVGECTDATIKRTCIVAIDVEEVTGKRNPRPQTV